MHVDGKGTRRGQYLLPAGDTISEPVFVARGDDAAEGDGWLLAAVWRARENRSDLAVFNATDVEAGPVALVQLGHRVPDRLSRQLGRGGVSRAQGQCGRRIIRPPTVIPGHREAMNPESRPDHGSRFRVRADARPGMTVEA